MHLHTSSHQTKLWAQTRVKSKTLSVYLYWVLVSQLPKLKWVLGTWQSSMVLDVGLDSFLLEGLLCYVHDLLRSTCSTSLRKTSALKICRFADNEDPKSRSLTSTFDRAVWECEKCVAPFEVLDCFCCLFHILYTGKILSWSDAINWWLPVVGANSWCIEGFWQSLDPLIP